MVVSLLLDVMESIQQRHLVLHALPTIIDAHVHLGDWPDYDLSFGFEDLESIMARYGYTGAVVMPALTGNPTMQNERLLKAVNGDSRLYPFVWVSPDEPLLLTWLQQRRSLYRGLKFHASISQRDLTHPVMTDVLAFADKERLPLIYHCGRNPISSASFVKALAPSYPQVKFIVSHLGGNAYDQIIKTMKLFGQDVPANVYFDTSTARHPDLLRRAIDHYGADRVLFGTDLPFTDQRMNWACIEYARLSDDVDFLGGTLLRLLKAR